MFVLFLTIIIVGLIATNRLKLELFPKGFEGSSLSVHVPWNAAVPQEVMEKLALPLEEELSTVRGLDSISSSCSSGGARVYLGFKQGIDMDIAYREVRDRLERAKLRFPDDVEHAYVYKMDMSGIPVCMIGIAYETDGDLYDLVNKHIIMPLSRIDGVANIDTKGLKEKEIIIEADKDRTEAYGLNIYQLSRQMQGDNLSLASGNVRDGGKKFLLKSSSRFQTMDELQNLPISTNVILKDIAVLKYEPEERRFKARVNGKNAMMITVVKESEANTIEVCDRIVAEVNKIKNNPALNGFDMEIHMNQGGIVMEQLNTLFNNGGIGAFFAALVLYFFLRRTRITLIIAGAIPLCLFIAIATMYFAGESLNLLTILGLVLCVGLLVDNSVVVAENIQRHFQDGMKRHEACIKGVQEIGLAITTATFTTVIVFLPALLVEGEMRFFMMRLALPVVVALLASLGVALVFIPLCVYLTLSPRENLQINQTRPRTKPIQAWLEKMYEASFGRFNRWYNQALGFFLKRRLDLAFLLLALLSATFFVSEKVGFSLQQEGNMASFNLSFRFPSRFTFDERTEYFKQIEQKLNKRKDYYELDGFIIFYSAWFGELEGWFARDRKGTIPAREVAEQIYKELPKIPGLRIEYQRMGEEGEKQDKKGQHYVRIKGQDPEQLEKLADQLKPLFLNIPGVIALKQRQDETPNELALIVDRDRANSIGVNPTTLAGMVGYALRGSTLPRFNSDGRQIPVRMRYSEENRAELADLNNFRVPTEDGRFSSIGTLTRPAILNSPRYIRRTDKSVSHTFGLELENGKEEETRRAIKSLQDSIDLPEGISFSEIKERFDIKEIFNGIYAVMLAITFIYLLMAFLFESVIMPISIVLSIPLAAIGSVWIHLIAGKEMDFLGIVGCVLLVGVVVNNGIVLIDYANRLRQTGMDRTKALLQASKHRFRPIAITALTTIIGMIPLTLSKSSDMGMSYNSFGLTLIGGMISGTLLTLLVVPVFYTLLDDAQLAVRNTLASVIHPQTKPGTAE
jgi:HAE1 family hydrophobic/amphiphilic exporter-1